MSIRVLIVLSGRIVKIKIKMGQCCSMSPLKEDDIRKVQGLVRKWAAKRKLAQLKSEYLHKLACKFLLEHFTTSFAS